MESGAEMWVRRVASLHHQFGEAQRWNLKGTRPRLPPVHRHHTAVAAGQSLPDPAEGRRQAEPSASSDTLELSRTVCSKMDTLRETFRGRLKPRFKIMKKTPKTPSKARNCSAAPPSVMRHYQDRCKATVWITSVETQYHIQIVEELSRTRTSSSRRANVGHDVK